MKDFPPYLDYPKPRKPQTNADRIRAMTDEELALWLERASLFCCDKPKECADEPCAPCILNWLKSPVEVDNGT